jgi:predicted nucleic acid-binding protein
LQGKALDDTKELLNSSLISISILTYLEVCHFFCKIGKTKELEFVKQRLRSFKLHQITLEVCEEAAKLSISNRISTADSIIYSTAKQNGLKLLTSDSDFKGFEGVIFKKAK